MPGSPHNRKPAANYRQQNNAWYGSAAWKARRKQQLTNEPLCWMCQRGGVIKAASIADHDPPHKGVWLAFISGPLRSLCKRHHDSDKAMLERGKRVVTTGLDGWPIGE